jgi:SagB-type dehydrogenase family enzyme
MPATPAASEDEDAAPRLRRPSALVGFWADGRFALENPLTGKRTTVSPAVAQLLEELGSFRPPDEVERLLEPVAAPGLAEQLLERDLLVGEGTDLDRKDRLLDEAWAWGPEARFFHYATQHVPFEHDPTAQEHALAETAAVEPPPPATKRYGPGVPLPRPAHEEETELWATLRARRTRRRFADAPVALADLARVLRWSWGATQVVDHPRLGRYLLKTSPSGGARHPIEVYPLLLRVEGLEPGLYHYAVADDELEPLRLGAFADLAGELCHGQPWAREAAALFFMTAVVERSMWKYRYGHAYRVLLLDAGHLGQTFHLVCTRLGLAPFTTAATDDRAIERELGLDGVREVALYVAGAGVPA